MIVAEVHRNDQLIMSRAFYDSSLTLEMVLKNLEMYIINEQLNVAGECLMRVRFPSLPQAQ